VAERVWVREITSQDGNRLVPIVRRSSGSVVIWRAQMVLLSAQGIHVAQIAQVTFTSPDRGRRRVGLAQPEPAWTVAAYPAALP